MPVNGGLLNKKELSRALAAVNWTVEMKDGRVPSISETHDSFAKHRLGGWTAEDLAKFITVAPFILRGLIPKLAYESMCLLNQIYTLVFSKRLRIQGWLNYHTDMLRNLLWRHAIIYEELYGLSACTENVEYSLHMTEDIQRHGPLDNYWCFMYERKVKYYKQQTTNMKSMCKTFADREAQLHFTGVFLSTNCLPSDTQKFCLSSLKKEPILLKASSVDEAISLKEFIESKSNEINLPEALGNGIFLCAGSFITLTQQQQNDVSCWIQKTGVSPSGWCNSCISFKHIVRVTDFGVAIVFREGENAVLLDSDYVDREWVVKIKSFLFMDH